VDPAPLLRRYQVPPDTLALPAPPAGWDARILQEIALFALQHGCNTVGVSAWRGLLLPGVDSAGLRAFEECCVRWRWAPEGNPWRRWLLCDDGQERTADSLADLLYTQCRVNPGYGIAVRNVHAAPADVHFEVRQESQCGVLSWWRP